MAAGPCFGYLWADAGGPLACDGTLSGVVDPPSWLESITVEKCFKVSWGVGCEEAAMPWVNTEVAKHLGWIAEVAGI